MNKNYQLVLDGTIENAVKNNKVPKLLLHSCCAPCSSYVLEYLSKYFDITVYYYNPNIYPPSEFAVRSEEQKRLVSEMHFEHPVKVVCENYEPNEFYSAVSGHEDDREGGERCRLCFELRLGKTAEYAKKHGFDYFTTTLSISPLKNAAVLNETGAEIARRSGVDYLFSDFKKRSGYKRSCELSAQYGLYRQDYCGCVFSMRQRQEDKNCPDKNNC